MQRNLLMIVSVILLVFSACKKDKCEETVTYMKYTPVYQSMAEIVAEVKSMSATPLKFTGKIYLHNSFIFVGETQKGIHIIDNSNPSNPQNIAFLNIPGNVDVATKGNYLYADCYTSLLTFDISNPANPQLVNTQEGVIPPNGWFYTADIDGVKKVMIGYDSARTTEKVSTNCSGNGNYYFEKNGVMYDVSSGGGVVPMFQNATNGVSTNSNPTVSRGGSFARFCVTNQTLYIIDSWSLHIFDVNNATQPTKIGVANIGRNIETIFPYNNKLFIGSTNGMSIYNIANPISPTFEGNYVHGTACDPVAVEGDYAYITLRSGTTCNSSLNQLEVVNVSVPSNLSLVATYSMFNPHGVGIENNTLFVCDDSKGLKVYNATNKTAIDQNQIATFSDIQATDVIPYNNKLIMIGKEGLYQYSYSNPQNITLLSTIPIEK